MEGDWESVVSSAMQEENSPGEGGGYLLPISIQGAYSVWNIAKNLSVKFKNSLKDISIKYIFIKL